MDVFNIHIEFDSEVFKATVEKYIKEKKKAYGKIFEEMIIKNCPNMGKELATHFQETQRVPSKISPKETILRQIIVKIVKIKGKRES